jgi:hypothetical protein
VSDVPLTGDRIRAYLLETAELLSPGDPQTIVVAGGSLLAMLGVREATSDVDSLTHISEALATAAGAVAERHDLTPHWLNDSAAAFRPSTFDNAECSVIIDHPQLRVLGAPLQQVFLMKLFAARAVDIADLRTIFSESGFDSPEHAAELFYRAYPHVERDEHLVDLIRSMGIGGA